jgi:phosphatidate phosphatase APP1
MGSLKSELEERLHRAAYAIERAIDRGRERIGGALAPTVEDAQHLAAYRGYATGEKVVVSGRLLANAPLDEAGEEDNWWKNLGSLWQRLNSREIPGAEVSLRYKDDERIVVTDDEGYYQYEFELSPKDVPDERGGGHQFWTAVHALVPGASEEVVAQHPILRPPADARFGVISDMDDTVIHTGATNLLLMARQTLFGNAKLRQPLAGVSSFYRALQHEAEQWTNPLFYVSSSPWNLYDLLEEFLAHNEVPPGPLLLRDYGIDETKLGASKGHGHKLEKAERIMAAYPHLPFVLIGDSGQDDAEIYAEAAGRYPDRIRAIYIRDVDPDEDTKYDARVDEYIEAAKGHGVPMIRARDSQEMAMHAAQLELITPNDVNKVAADVKVDEEKPATVAEAIEEVTT